MPPSSVPTCYLCVGPQSGGSTLLSYCFLQRGDLSGVLDWFHDRLPEPPANAPAPAGWWCKCTVASFRASEIKAHLERCGFKVRSVMIVRDVREVFDSLITKSYGRNGTTAEDPPLRIRMTRLLEDWHAFRAQGLPIATYESFVSEPESTLRRLCDGLGLPFDPAMTDWPKPLGAVWDGSAGSRTFIASLGPDLQRTLKSGGARRLRNLCREDALWLQETFAEFNAVHGYAPLPDEEIEALAPGAAQPSVTAATRWPRMRRRQLARRMAQTPLRLLGRGDEKVAP